jgi:hypothetical protein
VLNGIRILRVGKMARKQPLFGSRWLDSTPVGQADLLFCNPPRIRCLAGALPVATPNLQRVSTKCRRLVFSGSRRQQPLVQWLCRLPLELMLRTRFSGSKDGTVSTVRRMTHTSHFAVWLLRGKVSAATGSSLCLARTCVPPICSFSRL